MGQITVEICCGSYFDALEAAAGGAERIELNSARALGGLTPSMAELLLVKRETPLKVIAMARPRGAGFCYGVSDFKQMFFDCQMMMGHGADGIAFGCLKADGTIDLSQTELMVKAIKDKGGEAVFHRAFDCVKDPFQAAEQLISLGVDRILTSGLKSKAPDGWRLLKELQERFGERIEILAGSGIHAGNAGELAEKTGVRQLHSSCKDWIADPTTVGEDVSYSYADSDHASCFEVVARDKVAELLAAVRKLDIY